MLRARPYNKQIHLLSGKATTSYLNKQSEGKGVKGDFDLMQSARARKPSSFVNSGLSGLIINILCDLNVKLNYQKRADWKRPDSPGYQLLKL
jgi:hypothetical protein